jgi:hypothetical protein
MNDSTSAGAAHEVVMRRSGMETIQERRGREHSTLFFFFFSVCCSIHNMERPKLPRKPEWHMQRRKAGSINGMPKATWKVVKREPCYDMLPATSSFLPSFFLSSSFFHPFFFRLSSSSIPLFGFKSLFF